VIVRRAVVVAGPRFLGWLVEEVLDTGVVDSRQLPGCDGEFDPRRIDAQRNPKQGWGPTNW